MDALAGGLLGVLLGMRHALEADHLSAVSTLVAEQKSARGGALVGALWGVGHAATLLLVGVLLLVLRAEVPRRLEEGLDLAVAAMLIALGVRALYRGRNGFARPHAHPHAHRRWLARPVAIGVVHGLAGGGALAALVVARLPSLSSQLAYLALFGAGSIAGMVALSGLVGWPIARLGRRPTLGRALALLSGACATLLGVACAWPILTRWLA